MCLWKVSILLCLRASLSCAGIPSSDLAGCWTVWIIALRISSPSRRLFLSASWFLRQSVSLVRWYPRAFFLDPLRRPVLGKSRILRPSFVFATFSWFQPSSSPTEVWRPARVHRHYLPLPVSFKTFCLLYLPFNSSLGRQGPRCLYPFLLAQKKRQITIFVLIIKDKLFFWL